jgi:hypothetical protein
MSYEVASANHTLGNVDYSQNPPVGGDHAPEWENCGYYNMPLRNENAVHSMEHGAVWITYRPDLPQDQVDRLKRLGNGRTYVLVSPYPGLPAAVVASAWGRQLQLDSANDPRLEQFVQYFAQGPTTPEKGAPCTGGIGSPVR